MTEISDINQSSNTRHVAGEVQAGRRRGGRSGLAAVGLAMGSLLGVAMMPATANAATVQTIPGRGFPSSCPGNQWGGSSIFGSDAACWLSWCTDSDPEWQCRVITQLGSDHIML